MMVALILLFLKCWEYFVGAIDDDGEEDLLAPASSKVGDVGEMEAGVYVNS